MSTRHCRLLAVEALTIALAGCAPISAPIPLQLGETATPLERGMVRATVAGGGGGLGLDGSGGGADLRLRFGVGRRQEVGLEGELLRVDTGKPDKTSPRWIGSSLAYGMKLSWKGAPTDWFAVIAAAGTMSSATGESAGGDVAVVFSRPRGLLRPYGGLRGTLAGPIARPRDDAGGLTGGFVVPAGLSLHVRSNVDLFVEGGIVMLWAGGKKQLPSTTQPNPPDETTEHSGGYGAVGIAISFSPSR